ncbi:MAG: outer membrane beta-barrel protein [Calditrichaceae bacterium]|nr:porin family protein [Calditrichia bacterium]NUQ42618.1 outer membrane beta-barrel protein [Calditrichaceae bacterium]
MTMFIRLKHIHFWTFALLLGISAHAQPAAARMGAVLDFSYTRFDSELHFNPGTGLGGGLFYAVLPRVGVELGAHRNGSRREFDLAGGRDGIDLSLNTLLLEIHWKALRLPGLLNVSLSGGLGALHIDRKAYNLSLGALGQRSLPAESDTYTLFSLGAAFNRHLGSRVFIRLAPQAQFFSASGMKTNLHIKGGLGVVFF